MNNKIIKRILRLHGITIPMSHEDVVDRHFTLLYHLYHYSVYNAKGMGAWLQEQGLVDYDREG